MKNAKGKRLFCIMLSLVLLFSAVPVGAGAAYAPYLDDALTDRYNSIDQVTLTTPQQASLLLDKVDRALVDANLVIDIPVIGSLNMTSVDHALSSIYSISGNWLFGSATVGDLSVLKTYRSDISTNRRTTAGITDVDVLSSVVDYLGHCAPTLSKIVDGSFKWGNFIKSAIPPDVLSYLTQDIPSSLKILLWDLIHPTASDPMPSGTTLDDIVQYVLDNQVGGKNAAAAGFPGLLPGFDLDLATANGYRTVEEFLFSCFNTLAVPLFNDSIKSSIRNGMIVNAQKGGRLQELINPDYIITEYAYDRTKGLMEQLNALLGHIVNAMLKPGQTLFTWRLTANAGETQAELVKDNISRLIRVVIPLSGDTIDLSTLDTTEKLAAHITRWAVEKHIPHIMLPSDAGLREIAVLGMKEFIANIVPNATFTVTNADSNEAVMECGKIIGIHYFNNLFDFQCPADATFDEFLDKLLTWGLTFIDGLVDTSDFEPADTVWTKLDKIVWDIADKRWFNYEEMFRSDDGATAGTAGQLTVESLVQYVMDTLLGVNFGKLFTFFDHNANSSLNTQNMRQVLIGLVTRLVNGAVPNTIPTDITVFEDVMSKARLKTAFSNLITGIAAKKSVLLPSVLNAIVYIMNAAHEQAMGGARLAIAERVYCENGAVPSGQTMRVTNLSNGVNRGWRDAANVLHQDQMYKLKLVSLTNSAGLATGAVAGTVIDANDYIDVSVSGTVAANTEVRFDLAYEILDETGAVLTDTPLVASTYSHFYKDQGNYEATTTAGENDANHANCVLIEGYNSYLYTTDVNQAGIFSVMARHYYHLMQGQNGPQRILNAVVNGTLPAGVCANAPQAGDELDYILLLDGVGVSQSSYGTVSPYRVDHTPGDPQPYGIYPVTFQFDIRNEKGSVGRTGAIPHTIVVYNDFGLPELLQKEANANRQRADYRADADAEWNAYLAALEAGYALTQGNPDHTKMFADVNHPDGSANAYQAALDAISAAVTALDAKKTPNVNALTQLKAVLQAQESPAGGYFDHVDYELFTFRRWQAWQQHAWSLILSQENVPAGQTAPALRALDIKYAQHMLELLYPRMVRVTADKTQLQAAVNACVLDPARTYAPDTLSDYTAAKAFADDVMADPSATLRQSKVNDARVSLWKAFRNLKDQRIIPEDGSGMVVDSRRMFIYGLVEGVTDIVGDGFASTPLGIVLTHEMTGDSLGTGSYVMANVLVGEKLEQVARYTVVLFGDLNGDGTIAYVDQFIMNLLVTGADSSGFFAGGPFFTAADLNGDGVIDAADKAILDAHIAGVSVIDQRGPANSSAS